MDKFYKFYDNLFLYHYKRLEGIDRDTEVMPIAIISFNQSSHFIFMYIIFYYLFDLSNFIRIEYSIFLFYFIAVAFNFYVYNIKKRKKKLLSTYSELPKNMRIISLVYLIFSLTSPLLLIYFFNEFGKGFSLL